jgi:hypothetical protein
MQRIFASEAMGNHILKKLQDKKIKTTNIAEAEKVA